MLHSAERAIADTQVNTEVGNDLARAELLAFPVHLPALTLLLPLARGLAAAAAARRPQRSSPPSSRCGSSSNFTTVVFALNLVTGLGLGLAIDYSLFMVSRYREGSARYRLRRRRSTSDGRDGRSDDRVQLSDGRGGARLVDDLSAELPPLDGVAGAVVALVAAAWRWSCCRRCSPCSGRASTRSRPKRLQRADRDARPAETGFWYRRSRSWWRGREGSHCSPIGLIALGVRLRLSSSYPRTAAFSPAARAHTESTRHFEPTSRPGVPRRSRSCRNPRRFAATNRPRSTDPRTPGHFAVAPAQRDGHQPSLIEVTPSTPTYSCSDPTPRPGP